MSELSIFSGLDAIPSFVLSAENVLLLKSAYKKNPNPKALSSVVTCFLAINTKLINEIVFDGNSSILRQLSPYDEGMYSDIITEMLENSGYLVEVVHTRYVSYTTIRITPKV